VEERSLAMLLLGLHLILQNITAMFLHICTLPALRSLRFSAGNSIFFFFFFPQACKKIKRSSLTGILNKASAPVISGGWGASPRFAGARTAPSDACLPVCGCRASSARAAQSIRDTSLPGNTNQRRCSLTILS